MNSHPSSWAGLVAMLLTSSVAVAELNITRITPNGTLTWTNSYTNANYQVQSAATLAGPWAPVNNLSFVHGPNQEVSVQLQTPFSLPLALYRVVWTDAPPAQPVGTWAYQGFDGGGSLVVTGLVSITASNPVAGTATFQSVTGRPNPVHPVGSGDFNNGQLATPNQLTLPLPTGAFLQNNFQLSGQMVMDEYWGYWSYVEFLINPNGQSWMIPVNGRFSARRQN